MAMMLGFRRALSLGGIAIAFVACAPLVGADLDGYELAPSGTPASEPSPTEPAPEQGGSNEPSRPDAGKPANDAGGSTQKCEGKALACSAFAKDTECKAQKGCTWTPQTCGGQATGCSTFDPNVCSVRPGCAFDFDARECYPNPNWCKTTDATTCGNRAGCSWTGGCSGSATTCDGLASGACTAQRGCALVGQ